VHRADNLATFMCKWSKILGASAAWNPKGLSRLYRGTFNFTVCVLCYIPVTFQLFALIPVLSLCCIPSFPHGLPFDPEDTGNRFLQSIDIHLS